MRRFTSGTVDQYLYFVAVDATDLKTRETGLSSFTVYRARNGAAAAAYTTPTVAEVSAANMPGVYSLLLDEDMTLASGNDSEEVVLHITQASMAPVTLIFELYRPKLTEGETVTASSGSANAAVQSIAANAITATSIATDAITAGKIAADAIGASELAADAATEIATAVWATATRSLTVLDEDSTTLDLDATIRAAVGLATANLDTQLTAIDDYLDTEVAAIKAKTDNLPSDPADASVVAGLIAAVEAKVDTIDGIVDAILLDTAEIGAAGAGLTALATQASVNTIDDFLDTEIAAIKAKTDTLPADPADASDIAASFTTVNGTLTTIAGYIDTEVAAILAAVDTEVAAIKAKTDNLPASPAATGDIPTADITAIKAKTDSLAFTVAGQVDANIKSVAGTTVAGSGTEVDPWGP